MAQDYHIYIHDSNGASGNGGGSKTTPFSERNYNFGTKTASSFNEALSYATGEKGIGQTGVAALRKALPAVATTLAFAKVADKILTTGFAHQAEYTGNYKNSTTYNNIKSIIGNFLNPIGFIFSVLKQEAQFNKQNKEIAQQNMLVGDTVFKGFNKMGI